jgi:hypothetical protein
MGNRHGSGSNEQTDIVIAALMELTKTMTVQGSGQLTILTRHCRLGCLLEGQVHLVFENWEVKVTEAGEKGDNGW